MIIPPNSRGSPPDPLRKDDSFEVSNSSASRITPSDFFDVTPDEFNTAIDSLDTREIVYFRNETEAIHDYVMDLIEFIKDNDYAVSPSQQEIIEEIEASLSQTISLLEGKVSLRKLAMGNKKLEDNVIQLLESMIGEGFSTVRDVFSAFTPESLPNLISFYENIGGGNSSENDPYIAMEYKNRVTEFLRLNNIPLNESQQSMLKKVDEDYNKRDANLHLFLRTLSKEELALVRNQFLQETPKSLRHVNLLLNYTHEIPPLTSLYSHFIKSPVDEIYLFFGAGSLENKDDPSNAHLNALAMELLDAGRYSESLSISRDHQSPAYLMSRAALVLVKGDYPYAITYLLSAPQPEITLNIVIKFLSKNHDIETVKNVLNFLKSSLDENKDLTPAQKEKIESLTKPLLSNLELIDGGLEKLVKANDYDTALRLVIESPYPILAKNFPAILARSVDIPRMMRCFIALGKLTELPIETHMTTKQLYFTLLDDIYTRLLVERLGPREGVEKEAFLNLSLKEQKALLGIKNIIQREAETRSPATLQLLAELVASGYFELATEYAETLPPAFKEHALKEIENLRNPPA